MPLSRLSARRHRDTLVQQRTHSGKGASEPAKASRHLQLWEAIRRTREELDQWRRRSAQVDALFQRVILPREHRMTDAYCALTDALMDRFADQRLSPAERSLIGLWITDNLKSLSEHPFTTQSLRNSLMTQWAALTDTDGSIENHLARLARQYSLFTDAHLHNDSDQIAASSNMGDNTDKGAPAGAPAKERADIEPANDELDDNDVIFDFGWHKSNTASERANVDHPADSDAAERKTHANADLHDTGGEHHRQPEEEPDPSTVDETVSKLEQQLSVDRLFRQLARVLHPDREQDENLKAEKHVLMSQCLQARQDQDINTLLTLYCEYVGDLPDDLSDDSHEQLVSALQLQLKQLQQEFRTQRFGDPLHAQIVERYGASDRHVCEQRIAQHAKSLDRQIQQVIRRTASVQTDDGLQIALTERRDLEQDRLAIDEITGARY